MVWVWDRSFFSPASSRVIYRVFCCRSSRRRPASAKISRQTIIWDRLRARPQRRTVFRHRHTGLSRTGPPCWAKYRHRSPNCWRWGVKAAASAAAAPEVTASPEEAAAAPAAAETAVTYPLTVTDQLGREVTIETEPKTLASGYYISTSLLIALGVQDELVGVEAKADKRTIYSLSAPELQSLPSIGTAKEFDLEGCAALTPDLVIVPAKLKDSIPQMEELGLTVLAVKPEDQDKLYGAIDLLAQATNTVARGEELKSAIEDNLFSLHEAIGDAEAPTVYMAGNSSVLQTAGPAMYQNYMIENAGGLNAAASVEDTYWAEVSYEQVLDWDPDYIILASDADYDVDSVLNDAALADCTAVKEGHVYQLPHAIEAVDSPVPGSFLGSVYLGSVLHPEQVSEQFYHDCADAFYTTYYGFTPASYE